MNASPAATLVRAWVDVYTRGLSEPARAARRDEVDDDLWCQDEEAAAIGRSRASVNAEMFIRLLFGMPADVLWRILSVRDEPELERYPSTGARVLGILAILGAGAWGIALVAYVVWNGEGAWLTAGTLMFITQTVGGLALAAATIGLVLRFEGHLSVVGALAGAIGAMAALVGAMGAYQLTLFLPIGTAVMATDLCLARVLSCQLGRVHAVSGLLTVPLLIMLVAGWDIAPIGLGYFALMVPYLVSWIGIGVWLFRGVPADREADEAHRPS